MALLAGEGSLATSGARNLDPTRRSFVPDFVLPPAGKGGPPEAPPEGSAGSDLPEARANAIWRNYLCAEVKSTVFVGIFKRRSFCVRSGKLTQEKVENANEVYGDTYRRVPKLLFSVFCTLCFCHLFSRA